MVYLAGAINVADIMDSGPSCGPIFLPNCSLFLGRLQDSIAERSPDSKVTFLPPIFILPPLHPCRRCPNLKFAPFCSTLARDIGYFFLRRSSIYQRRSGHRLNSRYASFYRPSSSSFVASVAAPRRENIGRVTGGGAYLSECPAIVVTIRRTFYEIQESDAIYCSEDCA